MNLPCVFLSTTSPALSIASSTLSAFFDKILALSIFTLVVQESHELTFLTDYLEPARHFVVPSYLHDRRRSPSIAPCTHHSTSMTAAPTTPMASAIEVSATFDGSSMNDFCASGMQKITT